MAPKFKNWCFTLNNYQTHLNIEAELASNLTAEVPKSIEELYALKFYDLCGGATKVKYIVMGFEKGEEEETPHIQGYMDFTNGRYVGGLKKLQKQTHWEPRGGSWLDASNYCKKGTQSKKEFDLSHEKGENFGAGAIFYEYGTPNEQGKRYDIEDMKASLTKDCKIRNVINTVTNVQQIKFAESYIKYMEKKRTWAPIVIWRYGATSTGKSETSHSDFLELSNGNSEDIYHLGSGLKWWDGYDAHTYVMIDEFRGSHGKYSDLLRLLDKYPYQIETKGGSRQMLATHIYITSCYHPYEVYKVGEKMNESANQLVRRCTKIFLHRKDLPPLDVTLMTYSETLALYDASTVDTVGIPTFPVITKDTPVHFTTRPSKTVVLTPGRGLVPGTKDGSGTRVKGVILESPEPVVPPSAPLTKREIFTPTFGKLERVFTRRSKDVFGRDAE
ncbi:replication-associated protein [Crucivirus-133]|nr:replication-associated protein [Crucivirus-133]